MKTRIALLIVPILALAFPAASSANVRFGGQTSQGKRVTIKTDADGVTRAASIGYLADCGYTTLTDMVKFRKPFAADTQGFRNGGKVSGKRGNRRYVIRAKIKGERVDETTFRGTFKFKGTYFKKGKKYATCRASGVRWTATTG